MMRCRNSTAVAVEPPVELRIARTADSMRFSIVVIVSLLISSIPLYIPRLVIGLQ